MNADLLRIVDSIHRDKNIDTEIVFSGIKFLRPTDNSICISFY